MLFEQYHHTKMIEDPRIREALFDSILTKQRIMREMVSNGLMLSEKPVVGCVFRVLVLKHGKLEHVTEDPICNAMVNVGRNITASGTFAYLRSLTGGINSLGVGTDSTATAASQTKLNPSVTGSTFLGPLDTSPTSAAPTLSDTTLTGTAGTAGLVSGQETIAAGNANFAWTEIAMFDGTTNGTSNMLDRATFGTITKASPYVFVPQFTYQCT